MTINIPSLLIKTPLYKGKNGTAAQEIVDAPNSAVIFYYWGFPIIADHASQSNMIRLKYCIPHLTKCFVDGERYVCVKKTKGILKSTTIIVDGESIRDMTTDLCIYTCTGKKINGEIEVWVTFWKKK